MKRKTVGIFLLFLLFLSFPLNIHAINVSFSLQIGAERGSGNGQFYEPSGIAVAPDGRIYVVDSENNRVEIFNQAGQFVKAFGAKGKGDGQFSMPFGIAIGADGRLFVTDSGGGLFSKNSRVQVFDKDGGFLYSFGRDGSQDGELSYPLGIALDNQGRVFVADSGNSRISVFTTDGIFLDTIGSKGDGQGQFRDPTGIAVSLDGKVWVTDTGNNRVQVFDSQWNYLASIGSGGSERDKFSNPTGIAVDPAGRIVVVDSGNNRAHILNSKGSFITLLGSKGAGRAQFKDPQMVTLSNDLCYIVDRGNNRVQVFSLAREEGASSFQPFPPAPLESRVSFHKTISASAADIAVGSKGNLFVLDKEEAKVSIIDMDGNVAASFGSKGKKQGMFRDPSGLAIDENDNIYVSDTGNDRIQVFDSGGKYLFEFGGSGSGDGKLDSPEGIIYAKGKIWVADTGNNRIESFSKDGIYLGQFGKSGAEDGMFNQPKDIAMNSRGEIYVADFGNGRVQLFSSDGRFLKVIGKKGEGRGEFTGPKSLFVDSEDRLCVLESYKKNRIQVFDAMGRYLRKFGALGKGRTEMENASAIALISQTDNTFAVIADTGNKRLQIISLMDAPVKAPEAVRMAAVEGNGVQLTWQKAQESFAKGYKIYAASDLAKGFRVIGETTAPSFNIEAKLVPVDIKQGKDSQDSVYGIATVAKGGLEGPMAIVYPLGFLLYTQKNYEGAIHELEKIIKIDQKNMDAYLLLAKSLHALGKSGDAVDTLKRAIDINKDAINIRVELGRIYLENSLLDKAIHELQTITTMAPKEALAYNLLGRAYMKKKMYNEAIDALEAASRLDPRDVFKQDLNAAYEAKKRAEQGKTAGPPIDIQKVTINKVFSSLYKFYNTTPIGEIKITNNSQDMFPKIKVSLKVLNYMDFSTDKEVKDVKPGATVTVPLYASFNNKILEIVEDTPAQAAIEVSYYVEQKEEKTTLTIPFTIYNRNAITWSIPAMIAAFVTPKDEPVKDFARGLMQIYPENGVLLNKQMSLAMLIFDSLGAYGLGYAPNPNNPYEKASREVGAVDFVQYPRETFKVKAGDCSDLSILIASLLEHLGIETAFIGTPGHLHLMFKLDIDPKKVDAISLNTEQYIILDNQVWIPLEATAVGSSFTEAWYKGSEIYYRWEKEKKVEITKVHDAWAVYQPATLPPAVWSPALPTKDKIDAIMAREIAMQKAKKVQAMVKPYQEALDKNPNDLNARMQLGLIYAENELYDEAVKEFNAIIAANPQDADALTNIGNIYLATGKIDGALESYKKAEAIAPEDAEIKVNLAITYYKKGMLKEAQTKFKEAVDINPTVKYEKGFLDSLLFQ
ncbi:MAG: 6-bladed beta-propeller [Deltaproteobacteria bacterium]|nr:6-bladed beta-propeller [Deltaproteobacteria bacterium]